MAGGGAAAREGEKVAEGIIAKAAKSVLRDAEGAAGRDAARAAARDGADAAARSGARDAGGATLRSAESDLERASAKSAAKSGAPSGGKDVGAAARRRVPIRNESGLPRTADTAEARRVFDKVHGTEPNWSKVTEGYHGERPLDMARPHGHHIVFKEGPPGPIRDVVNESKEILERNGLDWYTGRDNLIWAPNRGHSLANAEAVRDALRAADGGGRGAVIAALRNAGRTIFGGRP